MDASFAQRLRWPYDGKMQVAAHRGASEHLPANTRASFTQAIVEKADLIETDIHRTSDGVLVCAHDPVAHGHIIHEVTYARLNEHVDTAEKVPTLIELCEIAREHAQLDIEIKETGYEAQILETLAAEGMGEHDYVITSFSHEALTKVRQLSTDVRTGLITFVAHPHLRQVLDGCGADFVVSHHSTVNGHGLGDMLGAARRQGIEVWAWTVNEQDDLMELLEGGVQVIITDRPAWAKLQIAEHEKSLGQGKERPSLAKLSAFPAQPASLAEDSDLAL